MTDNTNKIPWYKKLDFNSPVILGFALICLVELLINYATGGMFSSFLAVVRYSWADILLYPRLFTHVIAHESFSHFAGNFMMILVIGPLLEEKYGSKTMLRLILATALLTGLFNAVFFPGIGVLGASGIVFMLILLASFANIHRGRFPVTALLVGALYIGNEIVDGIWGNDNISQISHIVGGLCGAGFGIYLHRKALTGGSESQLK